MEAMEAIWIFILQSRKVNDSEIFGMRPFANANVTILSVP